MNKRLKEIAEQAGLVTTWEGWVSTHQDHAEGVSDEFLERFAELVRQDEQKPVAWLSSPNFIEQETVEGRPRRVWFECNTGVGIPFYDTPPSKPWVGLTIEEIKEMLYGLHGDDRTPMLTVIDAVHKKLKEKNGG